MQGHYATRKAAQGNSRIGRSSARRPFTRSVEFPKVALLAHGKRTRPRWTAAVTAMAETYSRDLNLSTRMTSARRSLGSLRRLRDLYWSGGAQLRSTDASKRIDDPSSTPRRRALICGRRIQPAQAQPRWARARRVTLWSCWAPPTRAETSGLARCHGAADELQNGCLKVILERTMASVPNWSEMRHVTKCADTATAGASRGVARGRGRCSWAVHGGRGADRQIVDALQPVLASEERRGLGRDVCGGGGKGCREEAGSRAEVEAGVEAEAEAEAKAEAEAEAEAEAQAEVGWRAVLVEFWVPTSVGSRPSATSLRGDGKVGPSGSSPGGRVRGAAGE
jgi:hypothetical protein